MERHPARLFFWWWRDTLNVHDAGGGKTPCTYILLVVERHPARPFFWWRRDTLHVYSASAIHIHTAGGVKTPCTVRPYMAGGGVKYSL
jgi:hypothetical protein